mgnify:CR=1 FL=1
MAGHTNPDIVTDGIVFCLDARDKNSYPGSGTAWNDLVGTNNSTLTDGPVYNTTHITFDGSDDHADISNLNATDFQGGFTLSCWVRFHAISGNNIVFGRHVSATPNERMYIGISGSDVKMGIGDNYTVSGAHGMSADRWYNVCVTREGSTNLYFVDLVQKKSTTTGWTGTQSQGMFVGAMNHDGNDVQNLDGDVALIQLYNRTLTTAERAQNFNAQRSRFGL